MSGSSTPPDLRRKKSEPNLPNESAAGATPCSGCLDLRPELYRRLCDAYEFPSPGLRSLDHTDIHYYISSFSWIEGMSKRGCRFCSILDQGMRHFWKLNPIAQSVDRLPDGKRFQIDSDAWNDTAYFYRPCIEIRPGSGLLVSVIRRDEASSEYETVGAEGTAFYSPELHFGGVRAPLEFYSISGQHELVPAFGRSVNIPTDLKLDRCGHFLNEWLKECSARHETCETKLNAGCPKRLVQVSGSSVRLVDAGPRLKENYTTLSHRWGAKDVADKMFKTTRSNLENLQESICWDSLPRTFQDAISITRSVSCSYIWIDSLCIIQKKDDDDDDDDEDWKEQAPQMSSIYANSYLNIAATASHDGRGGLLFPRFSLKEDLTSWGRTPVSSVELSHGVAVRPDLEHVHSIFFDDWRRYCKKEKEEFSPLLTRAWVFQEQVLPGRTVHFTYSEMIWECRRHTVCECEGLNDWGRRHTNSKASFNNSITGNVESQVILESWRKFVEAYTKLEITNHNDWPFAIAGIASRLQPYVKGRYLAGLWESNLPAELLWKWNRLEELVLPKDYWDLSEDTPPTWSWLRSLKFVGSSYRISWMDESPWRRTLVRDSRFGYSLTDVTDRPDTEDPLIHLSSTRLRFRGAVRKGLLALRERHIYKDEHFAVRFKEQSQRLDLLADLSLPELLPQPDSEVLCLLLGVFHLVYEYEVGLVLSDFCSDGSFYVRIGTFREVSCGLFKEAEVKEIEVR